jgi:glycine/D-amino acid oxidase-like deaminating enzyme
MMPDVVVIGGGIIGCSCAYYLARKGMKVHLLESKAIGSGASKAGMCHVVTWEEPEIHLRMALKSKTLYNHLREELPVDIEYLPTGSLALIDTEEALRGMRELVARLKKRGHQCEMLTQADMLAVESGLTPDIAGGAIFSDDVQVNPLKATIGFALAAMQNGAKIDNFRPVTGIEQENGRALSVITPEGRISTQQVVIAAGAWSAAVGKMVALEIPVQPRKGHLAVTAPLPDSIFRNKTLFSAGYLAAVSGGNGLAVACNIQQTRHGNLLLGSSRQFVGFDPEVDPGVLSEMLKQSVRYFPQLKSANIIRTWTGFRPYTPDILPIIDEIDAIPGLFIATGHEGLGITEAPVTGLLISQLAAGEETEFSLDELSFSRFSDRYPEPGS